MSRVWFVTGASRGLGKAIVEAALESGDSVTATARKPEQLNYLVERFGADRVLPLQLDVTSNEQALSCVQSTIDKFGSIDVAVNNAGYANLASVEDITIDDFHTQFQTNFFGMLYVVKAVLPSMRQKGSGHILQVSSLGGRVATPGFSAYQSAKWAVGGLSSVLQAEVASLGIKVTVLEPGGIKTDWVTSSMGTAPASEPYKQITSASSDLLHGLHPSWPEAAVIARVVLHITKVPDPPLRLLLGPDTVPYAKMAAEMLAESDDKWSHVTNLTF